MQSQLEELQRDYDEVYDNYAVLMDEKEQNVEEQLKTAYPRAWAMAYFGDDCLMMLSDGGEYIQIICQKEYQVSGESVRDIWSSLMSSMPDLGILQDGIEWERIGIKFLQDNGKEFLEFVFKKTNDGSFELESVNGDLQNVEIIVGALSNL